MDRYVRICFLGEGSYGHVTKCRTVDTGELVAIKKFPDSDKDKMVKKIAMREIKMLKQLSHENLVNLLDVFCHRKKINLVFEYVERSLADDLEEHVTGFAESKVRPVMWQVLRAMQFCHDRNVVHRDIKPENILISKTGVVKMCDFGFARCMASQGCMMTDYVATRWYRAPELLVGNARYGRAVDIWAIGCLIGELLTGEAVFSGNSDVDQFFLIVKCLGKPTTKLQESLSTNESFRGFQLPRFSGGHSLKQRYQKHISDEALQFLTACLQMDETERPECRSLMTFDFFTSTDFHLYFPDDLRLMIEKENNIKRRRRERNNYKKQNIKHKLFYPFCDKSPRTNIFPEPQLQDEGKMAEKRQMNERTPETVFKDYPKNKKTSKEALKLQCHLFPDDAILSKPDCYQNKHRHSILPQISQSLEPTQFNDMLLKERGEGRKEGRNANSLPSVSTDVRLLHTHLHSLNNIYKPNLSKKDDFYTTRLH